MGTMQTDENGSVSLSPLEIDAIGEVMNISMGSAATAVSQMLDKQVEITTPTVAIQPLGTVKYSQFEPGLLVKIVYTSGLDGSNVMIFRQHDMQMILNTLMGIPDEPTDDFVFDDLSISAACEVMNQMMGSSSTALAEFLNKKIDISTPSAAVMDDENTFIGTVGLDPETEVVTITFRLRITDMLDSEFVSVMTTDLVKDIIAQFINKDGNVEHPNMGETPPPPAPAAPAPQPTAAVPPPPAANTAVPPAASVPPTAAAVPQGGMPAAAPQPYPPQYGAPPQQYGQAPPYGMPQQQYAPPPAPAAPPVEVRAVAFPEFPQGVTAEGVPVMGGNLDLIMNVPLDVSIEIGTTKRKIRDIMNFTSGTVVELDKQAGAPIDVVVNGQLIAHGDVVVIDDNFGVRITEIVGTKDLINSLSGQTTE